MAPPYSYAELYSLTGDTRYVLRSGREIWQPAVYGEWVYSDTSARVKWATVRSLFICLRKAKANEPGEVR